MKRIISSPSMSPIYRYPGYQIAMSVINTLASHVIPQGDSTPLLTSEQAAQLTRELTQYAEDLHQVDFALSKRVGPFICFGRGNHSHVFAHHEFHHILIKLKPADFAVDEHAKYVLCADIVRDDKLDFIHTPKAQLIPLSSTDTPYLGLVQEKMTLVDRDDETAETLSMIFKIMYDGYPSNQSPRTFDEAKTTLIPMIDQATKFVLETGFTDLGPNFPRLTTTGQFAGFDFEGLPKTRIRLSVPYLENQIESLGRLGRLMNHPSAHHRIATVFKEYLDKASETAPISPQKKDEMIQNLQSKLNENLEHKATLDAIRHRYIERGFFEPSVAPLLAIPSNDPHQFIENLYTVLSGRKINRYSVGHRLVTVHPPTIISAERAEWLSSFTAAIPGLQNLGIFTITETPNQTEETVKKQFVDAIKWLQSQNIVLEFKDNGAHFEIYY